MDKHNVARLFRIQFLQPLLCIFITLISRFLIPLNSAVQIPLMINFEL